jgi:hypothetical protein
MPFMFLEDGAAVDEAVAEADAEVDVSWVGAAGVGGIEVGSDATGPGGVAAGTGSTP